MTGNERTKRAIVALLAAVALALAAAACGGEDGGDGGDGGDGEGGAAAGEITVWAMGAEGEQLGELAKDFMADNPGIKVKVTPIAWDVAHDKLITAVAGNQTPDVSQMGTTWMGEFAKTGALEEVPDDIDLESFFEGARDTAIVDDTAFGVPWYVETRLLYYRTDLAKKAGIEEPPGDWDALKEMARAMKEKAGAKWGIGLQPSGVGAWQTFLPFFWQNGGEILSEDGEFQLDSPEMVEALEYYKSFIDDGLAEKSWPEGFDITPAFAAGTHPMFFSGPWHMSLVDETKAKGKYAVAKMPSEDAGTSFVGGSDLVVFRGSDNKEAAWEFVRWLSDPATQAKWYGLVSALPSVESAWEEGELASDEHLALFGEQLKDAKHPPAIPKWEEIASEIDAEIERVTAGAATPEEGAKAMQEKASSIGAE